MSASIHFRFAVSSIMSTHKDWKYEDGCDAWVNKKTGQKGKNGPYGGPNGWKKVARGGGQRIDLILQWIRELINMSQGGRIKGGIGRPRPIPRPQQLAILRDQLHDTQQRLRTCEQDIADLEEQIAELEHRLANRRRQHEALNRQVEEAYFHPSEPDVTPLVARLNDLHQQMQHIRGQIEQAEQRLASRGRLLDHLVDRQDMLIASIQHLQQQ